MRKEVKITLGLENNALHIVDVEYIKKAKFIPGRIMSGYGTGEVLSQEGAWACEGPEGGGWIYFTEDGVVLEKNIRGHHYIRVELM